MSSDLTWYEHLAVNVIKCGPIPQHVAFIMDGNRRYAKLNNMEATGGHRHGTETLKRLMCWCKKIGIREVTVFVFSTDNFNRSKKEVDALLGLTKDYFSKIFECTGFLEDDTCIRIIGNRELFPMDIRKLTAKLELRTKNNKSLILNLAYGYASRDEITNAIKLTAQGVQSGVLEVADINEDLLSKCMYTNRSPDPEILVRTSGETRLSDFLLWQCQRTKIFFEDVLWPDYTIWHLLKVIFVYQRTQVKFPVGNSRKIELNKRQEIFLKQLENDRRLTL